MPNVTVRVEGADELRAVLLRARDVYLPRDLKWAHEGAAELVVDAALPAVPFRSGALRRSLTSTGTARSGYAKAGGAQAPYGNTIHWGRKVGNVGRPPGNRKGRNVITGRPFLVLAAVRMRQRIIAQFEEAMARLVRSID